MRTASGIKAYLETMCYGLLHTKYDAYPSGLIVSLKSDTADELNEDLILDVDGHPVLCENVFNVLVDTMLWRDGFTRVIRDAQTHVEIVCRAIHPAPTPWGRDNRHKNFPVKFKENLVARWRDRPCFSLKFAAGLTTFSVFLGCTSLVHLYAKGQWLEFHDYVVGNDIQE